MAAPTFIRIRVSPAKAAINSDRAIAEKPTGAWLLCQESSALQWGAQSNYRLKAEYVFKLLNPQSEPIGSLGSPAGEPSDPPLLLPFRSERRGCSSPRLPSVDARSLGSSPGGLSVMNAPRLRAHRRQYGRFRPP